MIKIKIRQFLLENFLSTLLASSLSISVVSTLKFFNIPINEYISILVIILIPIFIMHGICYLDNGRVKSIKGIILQDVLFICILFSLSYLSLIITNTFYRIGSSLNLLTIIIFSTIISELIFILTVVLFLKLKGR